MRGNMLVFDLCSGTGSATAAFKDAGHDVVTLDIERIDENLTERIDLRTISSKYLIERYGVPDFVWASPPCKYFSVGNIGRHWDTFAYCKRLKCDGVVRPGGGKYQPYWHCSNSKCQRRIPPDKSDLIRLPVTLQAKEAIEFVNHLVLMIRELELAKVQELKHSDLVAEPKMHWLLENPVAMMRHLPIIKALPRYTVTYCQYGDNRMKPTDLHGILPPSFVAKNCKRNSKCHTLTGRGSKLGTQALAEREAGRVPYGLSLALLEALTYSAADAPQALQH